MKKPTRIKLTFNSEVVRTLSATELGGVAGGETGGDQYTMTRQAEKQADKLG